ncbi:uncharacterized protein LOC103098388 [Monodelphis domestica]|uniref:uncharacterized protein LOC103098388 n=1 Tax=Monodelphis domestica TaxID=13616 RepID=UPI0024E1B512|nr:uncharacterized protein LOC103098388 [Monodelphis domestica]XP_007478147.2 uncharacterized protein LOC103098388 [Monodelphis domestica]XP_007478148.2 uncharacterized protein LOC103098388 [Monodelphis domestica]
MDSTEKPDKEKLQENEFPTILPLKNNEAYHLFVSYSSLDSSWAHKFIEKLEADYSDLKICYHERDFLPGKNIIENMVDCIQQSQKMLLILSQDFVQSRWCLLEANLSVFRFCMERKPVIPIMLKPCQIPLHLNHLTYLDVSDISFYEKFIKALCTPNHLMKHSTLVPYQFSSIYNGKTLMVLPCINKDNLPSWKLGTFSTSNIPDPLRMVIDDPEIYRRAISKLNEVSSPKYCFRYLCCRITLCILLSCISIVISFFALVAFFAFSQVSFPLSSKQLFHYLLVHGPILLISMSIIALVVNIMCWGRRWTKEKLQELNLKVGEANLILANHSVMIGCETINKLSFVYFSLKDCKKVFLETFPNENPSAEEMFQNAIIRYSSSYACCVANKHFPILEEVVEEGHMSDGICFCQYVSIQVKKNRWLGPGIGIA